MAKLNFVKSAQKDYPEAGIAKGESYYWWQHFRQPRRMSKTRPNPSQLVANESVSQLMALVEKLESWGDEPWTEEDRDSLVSELESIRDQEQDKFDNMPENFQVGDNGMEIENRISQIEDWIGELESIDFEDTDGSETPIEKALADAISL